MINRFLNNKIEMKRKLMRVSKHWRLYKRHNAHNILRYWLYMYSYSKWKISGRKYVSTKYLEYQIVVFAWIGKIDHSFSTSKVELAVKKIYVIHHFLLLDINCISIFNLSSWISNEVIVLNMFFRMEKYASIISYAWYMIYFLIFPIGTMHLSYLLLFTSSLWDIINQQSTILRWFVAILHPHMHTPNAAFNLFTSSFSKHMY